MICDFYAGQKFVCVSNDGAPELTKGATYTVKSLYESKLDIWVELQEGPVDPDNLHGYYPERFRPVVAPKTERKLEHVV